ncbi:MAG: hypothetical protein HZB26_10120 [Candidatus Hydrogenedentes bacterium]|nr:hypothetical protein [Candidatus Hydrogenedentota bacterium]
MLRDPNESQESFFKQHPTIILAGALFLLVLSIGILVYRPDLFEKYTAPPPESVFSSNVSSGASAQTPTAAAEGVPAPTATAEGMPEAGQPANVPSESGEGAITPVAAGETPTTPVEAPKVTVELAGAGAEPSFQVVQVSPGAPGAANLNVAGFVPLPGDVLSGQIVFFFDDTVVPPADTAGVLKAPFTLTPPVAGKFRIGKNFVTFGADRPFNSFTMYRIELVPELQSNSGKKINPQQRTYTFAPFVFEPERLWSLQDKDDRSTLAVAFPVAVTPDALKAHLAVKNSKGADAPFTVEAGTSPQICQVTVEGGANWPVTIALSKGLQDATNSLSLAEDKTFTYPSDMALQVTSLDWNEVAPNQYEAVVHFSKNVDAGELKGRVALSDAAGAAVPFQLRTSGKTTAHTVFVSVAGGAEANLTFKIAQGLPGDERRVLPSEYTANLTSAMAHKREGTESREGLTVQDAYWYPRGKDGLVLDVRLSANITVQDVKAHLEFSPAVGELRLEPTYDNHGFTAFGLWDSKQTYRMKLTAGLKYGPDGALLKNQIVHTTQSGKVPPYVGFGQEGKYYFPRRAGLALPVTTRNLDKAELAIYRMFPSNIAVSLANLNGGKGDFAFGSTWSEKIGTKKVDVAVRPDRLVDTPLELDPLFPADKKGVFLVQVSETRTADTTTANNNDAEEDGDYESEGDGGGSYYDRSRSDTKIVLWTNIGVLAHWQSKELVLFAHDLYSLAPLNQAKVTIYSRKNQVLAQGNTNEQGIVQFKAFNTALGEPQVAVVEVGDDYTFLELKPRSDEARQFDPDLAPYGRDAYDAFVYADRDLYRPGETAHLHWMARKNYGDALGAVPLLLTVTKPNGRVLLTQPTTLSALGTGGLDLPTQKAYPTGKYEVEIRVPGGDKIIGSYSFSLEEFVPNRIKAAVTVAEKLWAPGKPYEVRVNAQHLFGAPAADRKCEGKVVLQRQKLATQKWKEFTFDNDSDYSPEPVALGEARTDDQGNAVFTFQYTAPAKVTFPLKATAVGRVFELGGRGVSAKAETVLWPSPVALGVMASQAEGNQGVQVHAAAINPDETPAALAKVKITLEKQVWNYYVRRYYSNYEPRWSESFEPVETREVDLTDGKGTTTFKTSDYGYYRVRVHSDATTMYSTESFYSYGGQVQLVDATRPSLIKVTLDKPSYGIGEEAQVKIESPFDGKGIVVVQGDEIQQMIPVDIKNNVGVVKVAVKADQFPNVWIEASVVHAIQEGKKQVYPFSSSAVVNLRVTDPQRALTVAFPTLPKEIRPATKATIDVDVKDAAGAPAAQAEVTLAVVDEGIHSITNYKNPDPYGWVGRPRKPDYRRAHYYDKVAYDFEKPATGGDSELALRLGAAEQSWIKPLALWSGPVQTDANGRATVTMDIPEFTGQLRVVAVSCTPKAMGSQGANFFVRRPYMVQTSLPRYLTPGDSFHSRVTFFNNSDAPCKTKITWTAGGALKQGTGTQELEVAAHKEGVAAADFAAQNALGQGEIKWDTVVMDAAGKEVEHLTEVSPLPVHSPAGYQTAHDVFALKPGESREIRNTKFLEDERTSLAVTVGASPMLRLQKALEYVVGYPYGCVEQTTSRLMPMYLLHKNAAFTDTVFKEMGNLDNYIQAGISRLFAMQTASGGLGYWPGANQPGEYGSVYGLHFLTLVKRGRDYELPEPSFKALQEYVRGVALDSKRESPSDLYTRAYALYVLALDGDLKAIQQISRFDDVKMPKPARYLLAAALAQNTKDLDRAKLYLSSKPADPYTVTAPDDALTSDIRNTAIELIALQQLGADPNELLARVNTLVDYLSKRFYGNTHESAFIISALSEYLSRQAASLDEASATIAGPDKQEEVHGGAVHRASRQGAKSVFTVNNTGKTDMFVNVTAKGVPEKLETKAESHGVKVVRTFFTSAGEVFEDKIYKQTDSYVVGLEITPDANVKNLVVADLLPAGFEIENPRLDETVLSGETFQGAKTPSFLEIRDDRLVLAFDALGTGTHRYYYVVRAVTPGTYVYPPSQAECMYDDRIHATTETATIEVKP